jgi:hypothetical protein
MFKFEPVQVASRLYALCLAVLALVAYLTDMNDQLRLLIDGVVVTTIVFVFQFVRGYTTTETNLRLNGFSKAADSMWNRGKRA